MKGNDFPTVVIGSVGGPGQVGPEPMDAFHRLKFVLSHLPGEGSDLTARDAWRELTMQLRGAARAGAAVGELLELTEELRAQRPSFFRARCLQRGLTCAQPSFPTHDAGVRELRAEFTPVQVQLFPGLLKFGNDRRYHLEFFFVAEPRTDRGSAMALTIWRSFSFC